MVKKANPLAARIKRLMQKDEEVGKIAQATPFLIARAMELVLDRVCRKSAELVQARGGKTLTPSHIKACIQGDEQLAFLEAKVASVPDLPQGTDAEAPKPKRQRVATEGRKTKQATAAGAGTAAAEGGGGGGGAGASSSKPQQPPAAEAAQEPLAEGGNGEQAEAKAAAAAAAALAAAAAAKAGLSAHPLLGGSAFSRFNKGNSKPGAAAPRKSPQPPAAAATAPKAEPGTDAGAQQQTAAPVAAAGPGQQQASPFGNPEDAAAAAAGAAAAVPVQPQGAGALLAPLNSHLCDDFDDDYDS